MQPQAQNTTPTGVKIEGQYENERNAKNNELFKSIIKEAFGVQDVIVAHHLVYVTSEKRDGFNYEIVEEIPSADTLIFDHVIARKIFGSGFKVQLIKLACEPCETRDQLLRTLYDHRG